MQRTARIYHETKSAAVPDRTPTPVKIRHRYILFTVALMVITLLGCDSDRNRRAHVAYEAGKEIQFLAMCLDSYVADHEKLPMKIFEAISEIEEGSPLENEMSEKWKKLGNALDPWGSEYRMSRNEKEFHIWSVGINHIDENGLGDDVGFKTVVVFLPANMSDKR